jgi:hypothetical protein
MFWEIITGLTGVFGYYVLRYDPSGPFTFVEYLKFEVVTLVKGIAGFLLLWGAWSVLNRFGFLPGVLPEMNPAVALVAGFAAKKAVDYTLGRLAKLNGN